MGKLTNITVKRKAKSGEKEYQHNYYRVSAIIGKEPIDRIGKNKKVIPAGTPIRKDFYGDCKKAAEAKRDEYLQGIKAGLKPGYELVTFKGSFEKWLDSVDTR